ncbi:hypothetical protein ACQPWY_00375 [Pseudonocardia xinjiangensis]|uniref:hypothetical protein n=1 Tax=Pseudonocardia xinjiangensis TaxID=75289 RepID=UPI003D91506B
MTTFTDGVPPSVTPEPGDDPGPPGPGAVRREESSPDDREQESAEDREYDDAHIDDTDPDDADPDDDGTDGGAGWLRDEIQRRIAAGHSATGGRHARRESVDSTASFGYVPRHSVATPGPGAPRPEPVGGPVASRPSGLLRRERTGDDGIFPPLAPAAWSRPQQPTGPDPETDVDATRPGLPVLPATVDLVAVAPAPPAPVEQATDPPDEAEPGTSPGAGTPEAQAVPDLLGDPLFTARTPAPGSRTRGTSTSASEQNGTDEGSGSTVPDDVDSRRVRVVLAERKGVARPVRTVVDIQEGTGVGELLRSNLIGSQLAVALRFAVFAGVTLGVLPVLFYIFPEIGRMEVLGLRVPWLLLGVLVYPFLFGLGLWHTRTAERVEQNFADHVQD